MTAPKKKSYKNTKDMNTSKPGCINIKAVDMKCEGSKDIRDDTHLTGQTQHTSPGEAPK